MSANDLIADIAPQRITTHIIRVANTLDLDPEWGAIDLIEDAEAIFGFSASVHEVERCETVGDFYKVICAHTPAWDEQRGKCSSAMVFYEMRKSLGEVDGEKVRPSTPLSAFQTQPASLHKFLTAQTGLRLPSYELTQFGRIGGWMFFVGIISTIVALFAGHWTFAALALIFALIGISLAKSDPGIWPAELETVGDLVQRVVPLNAARLIKDGGRPSDRWSILTALAAEYGELPKDQIVAETYFHKASLIQAAAR